MQVKEIKLNPDKLTFQGPQIDGGYKIVLYIGEYEKESLTKLITLPQELEVTFKIKE